MAVPGINCFIYLPVIMIMIKVSGKGRACIPWPEGLTAQVLKACGIHGPTNDVYINFTKYV